ncbi:MAG: mechanosensitive ion channel family protein [Gammaproteobacteria bacterium]|nr:mechanosensitive ion channel family protein [Gammaproteobacteria bacterium]MCP5200889.1 mechanosensitive ion channel family protein [Gammaproteobacteria bacterium]
MPATIARALRLLLTLLACALLVAPAAEAQLGVAPGATPADNAPAAEPPPIPDSLASPRATMETFLAAMEGLREGHDGALDQALSTLDLGDINPLVRREKGEEIAWMLREVIELTREPDTTRFSTRKSGKPFVFQTFDAGRIALVFEEHVGWRFSRDTIAALPVILDHLLATKQAEGIDVDRSDLPLHLRLRAEIPEQLRQRSFILEQWQWIGIALTVLVGVVLDKLIALALHGVVRVWRRRYAEGAFRNLDDDLLRPLGLMAMALVWWSGLNLLGLPDGVLAVLLVSVKFLACFSAVWGAYRLVDLLSAYLLDRALVTASRLDDAVVPLVTKTIKVFVTVMGVVFIADNLDIDITGLLAGLGLGGLAFALAAKDVAGNLFGSITVLLDQTFHVGDWVKIGDVEGTVERIGFRSTRVRTFYNSLVSVPNSTLITANVDNLGARRFRRYTSTFGIAYDTPPERIEAFCAGLRELVRRHPYMRQDNYHIYFNDLGQSTLNILVYVFFEAPDWGTELRERHRFLLDAVRLAHRLGVEFAFPTRTLYMRQGEDTPLPVPADDFVPAESDGEARTRGRAEAQSIVAATLGEGVRPPPVGPRGEVHQGE